MTDALHNNQTDRRYELKVDDHIAYANYRWEDDILVIEFVFTPKELRGQGVASKLMTLLMTEAKEKQFKVRPFCGYAKSWLERHPEYSELVSGAE